MYNDGKLAVVSVVSSNLAPSKPVIRERWGPISAERRHHSYGGAVCFRGLGAYGSCKGPSFPLSEVGLSDQLLLAMGISFRISRSFLNENATTFRALTLSSG
jgi:hypothetical protein